MDCSAIRADDCFLERISRMRLAVKWCLCVAAIALSGSLAYSADRVTLRNGFAVRVEHRQTRGTLTRLFLDSGTENYVDVPSDQIVSSENIPEPPAEPALEPPRPLTIEEIVTAASRRYGLDPDIVLSLIHAESAFNPKAVSPKGAQGLMQLMPQTASRMGVDNPMDAAANVDGGTHYLRELLDRYNRDLTKALAAYNAGPQRVQQYRGVPPYPETITYITRVIRDLYRRKLASASIARSASAPTKRPATASARPATTNPLPSRRAVAENHVSTPAAPATLRP
jgi:hypothetical protein